jgi:VWFA-related protein
VLAAGWLSLGPVGLWAAPVAPPTMRTVYVTVVDGDGQPVTGLTAADFTLKEGGKDREITAVAPSTKRIKLAMLIEESVSADSSVRMGIFEFAKRMVPQADIALMIVGLRNVTAVDYTSDLNKIVEGINGFSLRQSPLGEHMSEGIYEQARTFTETEAQRPAIVAIALETMQASAERPDRVLTQLRRSGAVMHAVTMSTGAQFAEVGQMAELAERGQIIGEGTKNSGGRRIEVTTTQAVPRALQQVAADLSAQYEITYVLPDGVEPSERLEVKTQRKGVTLRAPSRIAN